jgi:hypothetical protein
MTYVKCSFCSVAGGQAWYSLKLQQNCFSKSLLSFYNFFPMILSMYLLGMMGKKFKFFFGEVFTLGKLYQGKIKIKQRLV